MWVNQKNIEKEHMKLQNFCVVNRCDPICAKIKAVRWYNVFALFWSGA